MIRSGRRLAPIVVLLLVAAACTAPAGSVTKPTVSEAWVRASTGTEAPTAAYLVITNPGRQADALLGATTPVAASVEIHETSTGMDGMTGMHPVTRVDVTAGATVRLEPGGIHLMLLGLTEPVVDGSMVTLTLAFEHAGTMVVQAPVRRG